MAGNMCIMNYTVWQFTLEFGSIGKTVPGCDIVNLSRYTGISLSALKTVYKFN